MVLPETAIERYAEQHGDLLEAGRKFEVIEGEVIFSRPGKLNSLNKISRVRDPEMTAALNTWQPKEVVLTAINELDATEGSEERKVLAQKIVGEAADLYFIADQIRAEFNANGEFNHLSEDEIELERFKTLTRLVEGHSDEEQYAIERAATAAWFIDDILEEEGYDDVDLLKGLKRLYLDSDALYTETAKGAYEVGKISVALEKGLLD